MANAIPDSDYFSRNSTTPFMDPGVVFGTGLDLGTADTPSKVSTKKWFVKDFPFSFPIIRTKYSEMLQILSAGNVLPSAKSIVGTACPGPASSCSLTTTLSNGVYKTDNVYPFKENITLSGPSYTFPSNKNFIFMVDGDLRIENNFIVPKGSTVIFIVSGNITVAGNVTRIEGIYSTDKHFTVEGLTPGADTQLIIGGSVIANASRVPGDRGFINERDLANNDTTPAVKINYRPDFVLHAPAVIRYQNYSIKEVAPGSR
jgi:hypothetical protein